MLINPNNPWERAPHISTLVDLGTHKLSVSVSGPRRCKPSDILLIFIPGAGASRSVYVKLQQRLSQHVRVLFYDRAGYDISTLPAENANGKKRIYASDTASDLHELLAMIQLAPPYVLVAHSYGGIIARSFMELYKDNIHVIAGLCLLDTATEMMLALLGKSPPTELLAVAKNVDWEAMTNMREESGMTKDEWEYALEAQSRCVEALKVEDTHASGDQLAGYEQFERPVLRDVPLSVVRYNMASQCQMMYDAGVKNGDGTEEERRVSRIYIEKVVLYQTQFSRMQLLLSSDATYRYQEGYHDYPIRNAKGAERDVLDLVTRARRHVQEKTIGKKEEMIATKYR